MRRTIDFETLKSYLHANHQLLQQERDRTAALLVSQAIDPVPEPSSLEAAKQLEAATTHLVAERLMANDRSVALLSAEDYPSIFELLMKAVVESCPDFDADNDEGSGMLSACLRSFITNALAEANWVYLSYVGAHLGQTNPYDAVWLWVETVIDVAEALQRQPLEILQSTEGRDELQRRLFTREEYLAKGRDTIERLMGPKAIKEAMIEALATHEAKEEMLAIIEEECMPEIRQRCADIERVYMALKEQEAERIYGQATA